jgi:hypothetical protein
MMAPLSSDDQVTGVTERRSEEIFHFQGKKAAMLLEVTSKRPWWKTMIEVR